MSFGVCFPLGNHETSSGIIHFFALMHIKKSAPLSKLLLFYSFYQVHRGLSNLNTSKC